FGTFGSPYTRRVAITLKMYGIPYQQQSLTPFGEDKAKLRQFNPLARVPVLQLDDDEYLSESHLIIDYLDSLVEEEKRLIPPSGKDRRGILNYAGVASGATDKLVTTLYEYHFRPPEKVYKPWIKMCDQQVTDGFKWLDSKLTGEWFVGEQISHADIAVAVFWLFGRDKRRKFFDRMNCSALQALSDRLVELDAFKETPSEGGLPAGISLG
ncbi:MAG: glutathione S-transferase family protein, partial [Pseudomonadota bacterium]